MAIELDDITSGYNLSKINTNFQKVEDYINDKVLHRADTGVAGEAKMERDLDMDGFRILNADIDGSTISNDRALRVPASEPYLAPLPEAEARKGNLLSFNINTGLPEVIAPASGSALDVLNQLASQDVNKGDALVTVKQPYTGAVGRTQHSKNMESLSVLDFGADPTGAVDSTAAFQAAIDAVYAKGGGEVFIPATSGTGDGTNAGYKISASLMLKPFVNLRGEGFSTRLRATTGLANGIITLMHAGGISGRYVRDLTLLGDGTGVGLGTDLTAAATVEEHCYGYDISRVSIEGFEIGFQLQGLWHSTIHNCTTSTCRIGLDLWGQNVSTQINGCHFKRDNYTPGNTFGIRIHPRVYAWSPNQVRGSRSEAIIINGETMCISTDYGVYVDDCLDLQMSNLDLDYIRKSGVAIINVVGGFSFVNSWVAADVAGTDQFFGVTFPSALDVQQHKLIQGIHINSTNSNPSANNVGISIGANSVGRVSIRDTTTVGGQSGVAVFNNTQGIVLDNVIFGGCNLYLTGSGNVSVLNSQLDGIDETLKQANNTYKGNTGTPATDGVLSVPVASGAGGGTLVIPNGQASLNYYLTKLDRDASAAADLVSIASTTITVTRPTPIGVALSSLVGFTAV